jgi:uncharacterized protein (TIGR02001 family)
MRKLLASSALVLAFAAPGAVAAQQLTFSGGVSLKSEYVASGLKQSDGPALQAYIEGEANGFYFGAWVSNTSDTVATGPGAKSEIDLYVGYRNEVGKFNYDIGYARYFYQNPRSNCCGEVILNLGYSVTDALSMGVRVAHDTTFKTTNTSLNAGYALTDKFALDATYGKINKGGRTYWAVGGSYAINDSFGVGLAYHDTDVSKGLAVLSLDYSFSFR